MRNRLRTPKKGLKLPYSWDLSLLKELAKINKNSRTLYPIVEVYAADKYSITGSGRTASTLSARKLPVEAYIDEAHRYGIRFEYLWNAISLGGREWDPQFQDSLYKEAAGLVEAGVDGFTVTHPLLILKLKSWFPEVPITTSVNNHLDSNENIHQLIQYTGIDRIMLDNRRTRNFRLIRKIHSRFPSHPIIVLVNEACLPDCVLQPCHQEHMANASRRDNASAGPDLCRILCTAAKLKNPTYTLKAPWIRPEDIHHVFEAGASLIKLAGRTETPEWVVSLAEAYAFGKYDGDIWGLVEKPGSVRPEWETVLDKKLDACRFTVNNRDLDGFIEPFVEGSVPCVRGQGCGACKWCEKWMHAVSCPDNVKERLVDLETLLANAVGSGRTGAKANGR
jgi:collagenase-like PrtC family protease